jgi:hypothetical protein
MTAQIPEILILDGERMRMSFCPPLPSRERQLRPRSEDEEEARRRGAWQRLAAAATAAGESEFDRFSSTACWRRYRGTWEIIDDRLYLMHVAGKFEVTGQLPLLADWFTGVLRVAVGEMLHYVHMGFGSMYAREIHIRIEHGQITGRRVYDNRGKPFDENKLAMANLPGDENRFPGDTDDFD